MAPESSFGTAPALAHSIVRTLPPLILHPFADAGGPSKLVESSRANLKLQGLLPQGEATREDLDRALLDGRYSELRMLFYVGKDLARWIEQCLEFAERNQEPLPRGICFQSFAALLIQDAPTGGAGQTAQMGRGRLQIDLQPRARPAHPVRRRAAARSAVRRIRALLFPLTPIRSSRPSRASATSRRSARANSISSFIPRANIRACWNVPGANRSGSRLRTPPAWREIRYAAFRLYPARSRKKRCPNVDSGHSRSESPGQPKPKRQQPQPEGDVRLRSRLSPKRRYTSSSEQPLHRDDENRGPEQRTDQKDRLRVADAELSQRLQPFLNHGDRLIVVDLQRERRSARSAPPAPRWPQRPAPSPAIANFGVAQFFAVKRAERRR